MKILLHINLAGTSPFKRKVKIKAPEGTSVEGVLEIYMQKFKVEGILRNRIGISILVNGSRESFQKELKDGDRLKVFRPMTRG